jgi:hypothetical protein
MEMGAEFDWWWTPLRVQPLVGGEGPELSPAVPDAPPESERQADEEPTREATEPGPKRVAIPAEPLPIDARGFFAGDHLELEALILDRSTGEILWTKRVGSDVDPRAPAGVRAAVDELLEEGGWFPPDP